MSVLDPYRSKARSWLVDAAIPLWSSAGVDCHGGGFFERLSFQGTGEADGPKRVRVQARQIYVMSHAHLLKIGPDCLRAAEAGFGFMTRNAWAGEGGFVHLLSPGGRVIDAKHDAYDHAFILLALAWYLRATDDPEVRTWIDRTMAFLDSALWDASTSSWHESVPRTLPRRQNPHMHLLEAFLALYEATGDGAFLARARAVISLFRKHFFRASTATLAEFFDESWGLAPGLEGVWREPGHHFEWVWLLNEFARLSGEATSVYRTPLLNFAAGPGSAPATGLVYDVLRETGEVHQAGKRCWNQTEALKAFLVAQEDARAARVAQNLLERYLATSVPGLWCDQLGAQDEPVSPDVPASTLYHLMVAFVALIA